MNQALQHFHPVLLKANKHLENKITVQQKASAKLDQLLKTFKRHKQLSLCNIAKKYHKYM